MENSNPNNPTNNFEWKYMLQKQQKAQVIRLFRPGEILALIDHIDIKDEPSWTKSRESPNLKDSGLTTEDIRVWMKFFLYSGTRFSESLLIHKYRDENNKTLYQGNGTIWLPRYKGKEKRSIQSRTIFLSYKGREILEKFFDTPPLPTDSDDGRKQTLTSLSYLMKEAGKRINLPERSFTYTYKNRVKDDEGNYITEVVPTKRFTQNKDGTYEKILKEDFKIETHEEVVKTNGCSMRSFRKTWESWLTLYFADNQHMKDKVLSSQGHKRETAWTHYLDISYDNEDLQDIGYEVEGFGIL